MRQGLKEVGPGLYEVNVGQLTAGSGWRNWTFTLENLSGLEVGYRITSVSASDDEWLVRRLVTYRHTDRHAHTYTHVTDRNKKGFVLIG